MLVRGAFLHVLAPGIRQAFEDTYSEWDKPTVPCKICGELFTPQGWTSHWCDPQVPSYRRTRKRYPKHSIRTWREAWYEDAMYELNKECRADLS